MADITLPSPGQKPWNLNNAITAINAESSANAAEIAGRLSATGISNVVSTVGGELFAAIGAYDARRAGVVANGSTDDRAALVRAIAAAATFGATLLLPPGRIRNAGAIIDVPQNTTIQGHGNRLTVIDGPGFSLNTGCTLTDVGFDGTNAGNAWAAQTAAASTAVIGVSIRSCAFANYAQQGAIRLQATADNTGARQCDVSDNDFRNVTYAVFIARAYDCTITRNRSVNASATGRHITGYAMQGCSISYNIIQGGITGICGLASRSVADRNPMTGNMVTGNTVTGVSEEGISFDLAANDANTVGVLDHGTVAAKTVNNSIKQMTLDLGSAFTAAPSNRFFGYYAVITTGSAAGAVLRIAASSGQTITVNGVADDIRSAVTTGDAVTIGLPMFGNMIAYNNVLDAGKWSILLWGLCVGNIISSNTCRSTITATVVDTGRAAGGVEVWGLDGLVVSSQSVTGTAGRAPSLKNRIEKNTLHRTAVYEGVKTYGGATGFSQTGNVLQDNTVLQ